MSINNPINVWEERDMYPTCIFINVEYMYMYTSRRFLYYVFTKFSWEKKARTSCHFDDRYIIMMLFREINKLLVFHMPNFDEKHVGSFSRKNKLHRMHIKT